MAVSIFSRKTYGISVTFDLTICGDVSSLLRIFKAASRKKAK
ncbi:MAG: hypothetical protein OZ917_06635 [Candidatus Brocadiaceae bacterium]|nr:hypothetical protein [Candidatus Brocadiaceae bacterium]